MELFELLSTLFFGAVAVLLLGLFISNGLRMYKEYERGVRFRLGKFNKVLGPGIAFAFPYIDSTVTVDLRSRVLELEELKMLTKERATIFISLVIRYHISSPKNALTKVADVSESLKAVTESVTRSTVGELRLWELVEKQEFINARLRDSVSSQAEEWGLAVEGVELTDVTPSERTLQLMNKGNKGFEEKKKQR